MVRATRWPFWSGQIYRTLPFLCKQIGRSLRHLCRWRVHFASQHVMPFHSQCGMQCLANMYSKRQLDSCCAKPKKILMDSSPWVLVVPISWFCRLFLSGRDRSTAHQVQLSRFGAFLRKLFSGKSCFGVCGLCFVIETLGESWREGVRDPVRIQSCSERWLRLCCDLVNCAP